MKYVLIMVGFLFGSALCVQSEEMGYVIRVTPTLVYIDKGTDDGIGIGDKHTVIRSEGDAYAPVADISVLRMSPNFSIAEIIRPYKGENVALLQWSIPTDAWLEIAGDTKAPLPEDYSDDEEPQPLVDVGGRRSIHLLMGIDSDRNSNLKWSQDGESSLPATLISSGKSDVSILGLRLGQMVTDHWRLGMTYRRAADDLQNLSLEMDVQWLHKSYRRAGPYLGAGLGIAQLSIDPPNGTNASSSANKLLINALGGVYIPGNWSFTIEAGYQKVMAWGNVIDASSFRTYLGVGRNF